VEKENGLNQGRREIVRSRGTVKVIDRLEKAFCRRLE